MGARLWGWVTLVGVFAVPAAAVDVCAITPPPTATRLNTPSNTPTPRPCPGDCNGNQIVTVDELVLAVNIALGSIGIESCPILDANIDGHVLIDELMNPVRWALEGCPEANRRGRLVGITATPVPSTSPTPTSPNSARLCGNGHVQPGEECDDANDVGGDGCAANCTIERDAACLFGGTTGALVQTGLFALPLTFHGEMIVTVGRPLAQYVQTRSDDFFNAGDIPVVIRKDNLSFEPVILPGLFCACVRAGEDPELFGPANVASGVIACGPSGLEGVDEFSSIDHNTNDLDPGCVQGWPDSQNPTVCNGRQQTDTSGTGPSGSMVLHVTIGMTTIINGGTCEFQCIPANGDDCVPCTEDDPNQVEGSSITFTTGSARVTVCDLNNQPGRTIDCDQQCGGAPCNCSAQGMPIADCELFESDPDAGIIGLKLVGAYGSINMPQLGDVVVTTSLECVAP